jgi:hypothetical protein
MFKKVADDRGLVMVLLGLGRTLGEAGRREKGLARLREARRFAFRRRMPYEAALGRLEIERLTNRRLSLSLLKPFGISSSTVSAWLDIP